MNQHTSIIAVKHEVWISELVVHHGPFLPFPIIPPSARFAHHPPPPQMISPGRLGPLPPLPPLPGSRFLNIAPLPLPDPHYWDQPIRLAPLRTPFGVGLHASRPTRLDTIHGLPLDTFDEPLHPSGPRGRDERASLPSLQRMLGDVLQATRPANHAMASAVNSSSENFNPVTSPSVTMSLGSPGTPSHPSSSSPGLEEDACLPSPESTLSDDFESEDEEK